MLNDRLGGETPATGPEPVPVPLNVAVCVLPATPLALSVRVRVPLSSPLARGEKATVIEQVPAEASVLGDRGQLVSVSAKFALTLILLMVTAVSPLLVTVTVCAELVVPKP